MDAISRDWASRAALPQHVVQMVNNFPSNLHPMSQFSAGITAMQSESKFAKAYNEGVAKTKYWEVRTMTVLVVCVCLSVCQRERESVCFLLWQVM